MAASLLLSIKVVTPLIAFMGLGYCIRRRGWMSPVSVKEMNNVVFKVLLPAMVFYNICQSDMSRDFDLGLLAYAVIMLVAVFVTLWALAGKFIKDRTVAPVMVQGIYRSNFVLFGLQVTASICGSGRLGMAMVLISVIVPIYNVLAVILFEAYRQEHIKPARLLKGIVANPLVLASAAGLSAVFAKIHFNAVAEDILESISQMATPMSLILLGGTITFDGVKKYWKYTLVCSVGRLAVIPVLFLSTAICLGYRGAGLTALMVMSASPTAVSSFPMAAQMGGNSELAGQIVAVTTIFSTITIFIWTYVLSYAGLIGQ